VDLKGIVKSYRRKRAMKRIRSELAFFGLNTQHLSDEEVEIRLGRFTRIMSNSGLTVKEMQHAFSAVGWSLSKNQKPKTSQIVNSK